MGAAHGSDHTDMDKVMDMPAHRAMFKGFMKAAEWGTLMIVMLVALLVVGFAMGLGWWVGLIAWVGIGLAAGALLGLGGAWWATLAVSTVLFGLVGVVISLTAPGLA